MGRILLILGRRYSNLNISTASLERGWMDFTTILRKEYCEDLVNATSFFMEINYISKIYVRKESTYGINT